jgi:hypothetical protein
MRRIGFVGRFSLIALCAIVTQKLLCQSDFTVFKSWDFEREEVGSYTKDEIIEDFVPDQIIYVAPVDIVSDQINGAPSQAMRITNWAKDLWHGFGMTIPTGGNYDELYVTYNWKFSNEFNSTHGGKMSGFNALPIDLQMGDNGAAPRPGYGYTSKINFAEANSIYTYHYDQTPGKGSVWPWGDHKYRFNSVWFDNGTWYNVTERLVMNTFTDHVANQDGIFEVWVDGRMIFQETDLILKSVEADNIKVNGVEIDNYFGGTGFEYTPQTECYGYIDNISFYLPNNDPTLGTHNLHDPGVTLHTPSEITDRTVYYDQLITQGGELHNTQYGSIYSSCIDEAYLIDAGEGNTITYNLSWTIGGGDYLFFYDGNQTDSKLIRKADGSDVQTNQTITSTGRYMFVRFSTNTDIGSLGFDGKVSFNKDGVTEIINNPPSITEQEFIIKENEFTNNSVGRIIAYDIDPGQQLNYTIDGGNESGLFKIDNNTGSLTTTRNDVFNFDLTYYELIIKVTDNGKIAQSSTARMKISFLPSSTRVYIDPGNVSDPSKNGSLANPYASWDDVSWHNGYTYLQKRGTSTSVEKIVIGADNVTLGSYGEGELAIITSETNTYLINGYDRQNVTVSNLHLISDNAESCIYFLGGNSDNIVIEQCTVEGKANAIRITDGKRAEIKYNNIKCENMGVYSTATENNIYYNIFINNILAVNLIGTSSNAYLYNNVFVDNQESVVATYGNLTLFNNIFYLSNPNQKAIISGSKTITSDHNIYYPEQTGFIEISNTKYNKLDQLRQNLKLDMHSLNMDPLFVDMINEDFALGNYSPAIDAGIDLNIEKDYFGNKVPNSNLPDIGIGEFTGNLNRPNKGSIIEPVVIAYPNPSSGLFTLSANFPEQTADGKTVTDTKINLPQSEIKIVDNLGKTIISRLIDQNVTSFQESIDMSNIANGLYFIVLHAAGKIVTEKLILSH